MAESGIRHARLAGLAAGAAVIALLAGERVAERVWSWGDDAVIGGIGAACELAPEAPLRSALGTHRAEPVQELAEDGYQRLLCRWHSADPDVVGAANPTAWLDVQVLHRSESASATERARTEFYRSGVGDPEGEPVRHRAAALAAAPDEHTGTAEIRPSRHGLRMVYEGAEDIGPDWTRTVGVAVERYHNVVVRAGVQRYSARGATRDSAHGADGTDGVRPLRDAERLAAGAIDALGPR